MLQEESEELLQQTSEALDVELRFGMAYNLDPAVRAVEEGNVLNARQLHAVAITLQTAASLKEQVGIGDATPAGNYAGAICQDPVYIRLSSILESTSLCLQGHLTLKVQSRSYARQV